MRVRRLFGLWLVSCVVSLLSCSDDCVTNTCSPGGEVATIEGVVNVGSLPFEGRVRTRQITGDYHATHVQYTALRPGGSFQLQVPYGAYQISIEIGEAHPTYFDLRAKYHWREEEWALNNSEADTVLLNEQRQTLRLDLTLSSLVVEVEAPQELEGERLSIYPEHLGIDVPYARHTHWRYAHGEVINGVARFELPGFYPGTCRLQLAVNEYRLSEWFWLPAGRNVEEADTVRLHPGQITRYRTALPEACATLSGEVRGSWQTFGTNRPDLALYTADSVRAASTQAEADGSFAFRMWQPEPVKLLVDIDGSARWYGGDSFAEADLHTPTPGSAIEDLVHTESGIFFSLDQPGYPRWMYMRISVFDAGTHTLVTSRLLGSSNLTSATISNLGPGEYNVYIDDPELRRSWVPQWFDRATDFASATTISVPSEGGVATASVTLEPGGEIHGRAIAPEDNSCPIPVFYVVNAISGECLGRTGCIPCECGGCICMNPHPFSARGIPDGTYKVGVALRNDAPYSEDPPPHTVWYPGTSDWEAAETIEIQDQAIVSDIDICVD